MNTGSGRNNLVVRKRTMIRRKCFADTSLPTSRPPFNCPWYCRSEKGEYMALEYCKQTIRACLSGGRLVVPVEAKVGVGTGLAYHPNLSWFRGGYCVRHVASGCALHRWVIPTESGVQTF